jgi:hypothetical protein
MASALRPWSINSPADQFLRISVTDRCHLRLSVGASAARRQLKYPANKYIFL